MPNGFSAQVVQGSQRDAIRVMLGGDLDEVAARELVGQWRQWLAPHRRVELDLSGVTYFSSSGVSALVQATIQAQSMQCSMTIGRVSPIVAKVLQLTGLDDQFEVAPE